MATKQRANPKTSDPTDDRVTYVLTMRGDNLRRVTVPKNWHVTFGPIAPTVKAHDGPASRTGGVCLRFYDGEVQKACFTDVESFRVQEDMVIEDRVVKREEQIMQREDMMGGQAFRATAESYEWRNPDKLTPTDNSGVLKIAHAMEKAAQDLRVDGPAEGGRSESNKTRN